MAPRQHVAVEVGADITPLVDGMSRAGKAVDGFAAKAGRSARQASGGFAALGNVSNRARASIQNAAFQIGDFFVQIASGTAAMRAAAQQLPQLLGGLGVIGAVAGAAAAALVPLIGRLFQVDEAAKEAAEAIERITEETQKAERAYKAFLKGLSSVDELAFLERIAVLQGEIAELQTRTGRDISRQNEVRIASRREEIKLLETQLRQYREANDNRERMINFTKTLTQVERFLTEQVRKTKEETLAAAEARRVERQEAMAAAREFMETQGFRSRFAGEEAVMGQPVVPVGQGEAPPELPSIGTGTAAAIIAEKPIIEEELSEQERIIAEHIARMKALTEGGLRDKIGAWGNYFTSLTSLSQTNNERLLNIAKAFGAAQALIDAWLAHNEVLKDPFLPWWQRIAAAAQILGAGLGAVNAIKSVTSGGGGGAFAGGGVAGGGARAAATTATTREAPLQVTLNSTGPMAEFFRQMAGPLLDELNKEAGDRGYQIYA